METEKSDRDVTAVEATCVDYQQRNVSHGEIYIPGPNRCSQCVCYHQEPMWCQLIYCQGPPWKTCLRWEIGDDCCEFYCLEIRSRPLKRAKDKASLNGSSALLVLAALLLL